MKTAIQSLLILILFLTPVSCLFAQGDNQINDLNREGNALRGEKKYDEALAKFNGILKIDAENSNVQYQIAYTLFAADKSMEAIPYLEKVVKSPHAGLVVASYAMMGTIYDHNHQPQLAIDAYNQAIKLAPTYQDLYYNLGLVYSRNQQYAEAETAAIEAIKQKPKHTGSQRLYALATFHQNKRANALLAFCSFLLLEPSGPQADEAFNNIQHILQGGVLKSATPDSKETAALNAGITAIVASAKAKKLTGEALLEYELKGIFIMIGQAAEKKTDKTFFDKFFADYFYKLAQSANMPAFTKMITEHAPLTGDLDSWVKGTERGF